MSYDLRHMAKEYLELDDLTINQFISQFYIEWLDILIKTGLDEKTALKLLEKLLGKEPE